MTTLGACQLICQSCLFHAVPTEMPIVLRTIVNIVCYLFPAECAFKAGHFRLLISSCTSAFVSFSGEWRDLLARQEIYVHQDSSRTRVSVAYSSNDNAFAAFADRRELTR